MGKYSELDIRMKTYYEQIPNTKLIRKVPVAVRIDGKAFHSFTKGFKRPFDEVLIAAMQNTAKYLCENIQGCVMSYQQSDEITLILIDYKNLDSAAWFDYRVQKMCSIAASMGTMAFNKFFSEEIRKFDEKHNLSCMAIFNNPENEITKLHDAYWKACHKGAMFDARCFNIPKEEVANLIYWRQLDATRNSIQMVGQAYFSHKELNGKSANQIQDMLFTQKGINWNDFPTHQKRGSCCIKERYFLEHENGKDVHYVANSDGAVDEWTGTYRNRWIVDTEIPIFKEENRNYINDLVYLKETPCEEVKIEHK